METPKRIIQLKLMNGESIIAFLENIDFQTQRYVIQKPYKIYTGRMITEQGPVSTISLVPWFEFEPASPVVNISALQVISHTFLTKEGESYFIRMLEEAEAQEAEAHQTQISEDTPEEATSLDKPDKTKLN